MQVWQSLWQMIGSWIGLVILCLLCLSPTLAQSPLTMMSGSESEPVCFIQLTNGQVLDLTRLCGNRSQQRIPRPLSSFYDSPLKLDDEPAAEPAGSVPAPPSSPQSTVNLR